LAKRGVDWAPGPEPEGGKAAALRVAATLTHGMVVTLFPDAGYKYVSERFWNEG